MQLPDLFTNQMQAQLGDEWPLFLNALNAPSPVSIRLNPFKKTESFDSLEPVPWHPLGRYLPERPVFTLDPLFQGGAYYVQEASSMFVAEALRQTTSLSGSLKVLDLCAAPGGKTTLLASMLSSDSLLVANEVIHSRIPALRMNLEKWGVSNVCISNHDPAAFRNLESFFDVVLVDAPCSGEGLFRRNPAACGEWSVDNQVLCAARQRRILSETAGLLKPGGLLVYSTCTYNPAENDLNVEWMCESQGYEVCRLEISESWNIETTQSGYQFYPHKVRGEGFYLSILRKTGEGRSKKIRIEPKKGWKKLRGKETGFLREWLADPEATIFYEKPNGELVFIPAVLEEEFESVTAVLKRRSFGVLAGYRKKKGFIPSHALALNVAINKHFPSVSADLHEALRFLKKDDLSWKELPKGWYLIDYQGIKLGWIKALGNRVNNYLPGDWRIKMNIDGFIPKG